MDIYIARGEERKGPYSEDSIRQFLADGELDGTELAWHEGLAEWIDLNEMVNGVALDKDASTKGQAEVESEPLDEETLEQVNKIKGLIADGHGDIAWQLMRSLNNPRLYEGLLEDCPVNDDGWVNAPEYLSENGGLFINLLLNLPESAKLQPELNPPTKLILLNNQITAQQIDELQQVSPECDIISTIWEFETGDWVLSSPAIGSDGTVYVGSDDNKLYAINGKSGVKLWEFETMDPRGQFGALNIAMRHSGSRSNYAAIPLINVSTCSTTFSSTRFRAGARSANFSGRLINSMITGSGKGFLPV